MPGNVVRTITIYPLAIPLRRRVQHAGSRRGFSDSIVVSVELADGAVGFGETLPRVNVTGETPDSVVRDVREVYGPAMLSFRPDSFPDALEAIEALPWRHPEGRLIPAARAAVELALLDASMRSFGRGMDDVVQWMGLPGFGSPGSVSRIRYSGVLATRSTRSTMRQLRLLYYFGVRNFKLKVGMQGDRDWFTKVARYLRRPLAAEKASLRVDANGAWSPEQAEAWLERADYIPLAAVEQPIPRGKERHLIELRNRVSIPIVHDESVVTLDDARRLVDMNIADGFNIRIGKCGGLLPSLRIAALARRENVRIQLGWMVGETSILSAAGLRFLQVCPGVAWAEGCAGRYLLRMDATRDSLRVAYGGRPPQLGAEGLGVSVSVPRLTALCSERPIVAAL